MDEVERCPLHIAAFAVLLLDLLHLLGGCWTFSGLVGAGCAAPNTAPNPPGAGRATASPRALAPGRGGERETAKIDAAKRRSTERRETAKVRGSTAKTQSESARELEINRKRREGRRQPGRRSRARGWDGAVETGTGRWDKMIKSG